MTLCYNFTRVLNILGFDRFIAYMAEKASVACKSGLASPLRSIRLVSQSCAPKIALQLTILTGQAIPSS